MRIALITPGFSASAADWCIPVLLDHVRLLAREHDVHVFTLRYPHQRASYQVYGATVHPFGGAEASGLARLPLLMRASLAISAVARQQPFDLYHGFWADEPGLLAVLAGRAQRRPAVVSLMGGELVGLAELGYGGQLSRANRWMTRLALRNADRVLVGSSYLRRLAEAYTKANRLIFWPLGVDTALFSPGAPPPEPPLAAGRFKLLQVAALLAVKDHLTSLRALKLLSADHQGIHLHLVGQGPLRAKLERISHELGIAEQVTFHGAVAHADLPAYYRSADLCILTSRHEAQALVTLEAAACGRATLGTAVGLLPDLHIANRTVPVGDAQALAAAIAPFVADQQLLGALNSAAAALAQSRYSQARSIQDLLALYGELVAAGSGR